LGKRKQTTYLLVAITVAAVLILSIAFLSLFVEKEEQVVSDLYLEELFSPDIHHDHVKVVRDDQGRKVVVVRMKEKISEDTFEHYNRLLQSRGVNIYGQFHYGFLPWQKSVTDYSITITRKAEDEPDTVEISKSEIMDPETGKPIVTAKRKRREFRYIVQDDFGKRWERIRILPEREQEGEDPPFGRYPGAKMISFHRDSQGGILVDYAIKDTFENVVYYHKNIMEQHVKDGHVETISWEEELRDPLKYKIAFEIFGIRTRGVQIRMSGDWASVWLRRSNDPMLADYVWITYKLEHNFFRGKNDG
jgi:hypothetical protein